MKILVTSDTHGSYGEVSDYILENGKFDLLIHAGDGNEDCENISYETGISYYTVKGNNDFFSNEPYNRIIELEDKKILLSHGHKEHVDFSLARLIEKAKKNSCDIVIFGHIHRYVELRKKDLLILNPGSVSLPRDGEKSAMILTIDDNIKVERVVFD